MGVYGTLKMQRPQQQHRQLGYINSKSTSPSQLKLNIVLRHMICKDERKPRL